MERNRHHSTFYKILTTTDNAGYVINSLVSAILDFYLVLNLGPSWWYLLLAMVIGIELTKQVCLIRANTLKTIESFIGRQSGKIHKKIRRYSAFFLVFTFISLVSSIGFSLVLSNKTSQSFDIEKTTIQKNIDSLTESKNTYLEANKKYTELQQSSDDSEKAAKETLRTAEDEYNKVKNEATDAYEKLSRQYDQKAVELGGTSTPEFKQWLINVDYYNVRDYGKGKKESTALKNARTAYERAQEDYDDLVSGKAITRAKAAAEAAKEEYDSKVALMGTLDELEIQLKKISQEELEAADSTKEFMLIARTFKVDEYTDKIQFFIFMLLALVTEVGIVINSPIIILDDELLGLYARDIPENVNIKQLKKKIADYNRDFGYDKKAEEYSLPKNIIKELNDYDKKVVSLSTELTKLKDEYGNLTKIHDTLNIEYKNLMDERNEYAEQLNKLTENYNASQEIIETYSATKDSDDKIIHALQEQIEKLGSDLKEAKSQLEEANVKLESYVLEENTEETAKEIEKTEEEVVEEPVEEPVKEETENKRTIVPNRTIANERHAVNYVPRIDDPAVGSAEPLHFAFGHVAKGTAISMRKMLFDMVPAKAGECDFDLLTKTDSYDLSVSVKKMFIEWLKSQKELFTVDGDSILSLKERSDILAEVFKEIH